MWHAKSPYLAIRQMYSNRRRDGRPRPVIDLEAHYENTHHWFQVGSRRPERDLRVTSCIAYATILEGEGHPGRRLAECEHPSPSMLMT
jgi:hypothetical protein